MEKVIFTQLTSSEIKQLFREEIQAYFSENPVSSEPSNQLGNVVDLDGLLKARPFIGSRSTIYKKISKGLIPHSKRGKKLYFDLDEIDRWLLSNKVKSVTELENEAQNYLYRRRI